MKVKEWIKENLEGLYPGHYTIELEIDDRLNVSIGKIAGTVVKFSEDWIKNDKTGEVKGL